MTWEQYGGDLEENLRDLHERLRRGAYRARPKRIVFGHRPGLSEAACLDAGGQSPISAATVSAENAPPGRLFAVAIITSQDASLVAQSARA